MADAGTGCATDLSCADTDRCTVDSCASDGGCEHEPLQCDDGNWCRVSFRCDPQLGCVSDPRLCDDGIVCHHSRCEASERTCVIELDPSLCAPGELCGPEGCSPCTRDAQCDDGIPCTKDTCLPTGLCSRVVDDQVCTNGSHCGPTGCGAWAYAVSTDTLYDIEVHTGVVQAIGFTGTTLTDVAFSPDGRLYGTDGATLYSVDRLTVKETQEGTTNVFNALDFGADGTLYGAGGKQVFSVDLVTGFESSIAMLPGGLTSAGDIAFVGDQLFLSVNDDQGGSNALVKIDPKNFTLQLVGYTGYPCVYGLAAFGQELFGFTCEGFVISIDPNTGAAVTVYTTELSFQGASSR